MAHEENARGRRPHRSRTARGTALHAAGSGEGVPDGTPVEQSNVVAEAAEAGGGGDGFGQVGDDHDP